MTATTLSKRWTHAVGGAFALSTLMFAAACNTAPPAAPAAAQPLGQQAAASTTPVVVSCEPHQRTLVRPAVVNGMTVSQVECVAAANVPATAAPMQPYTPAPAMYQRSAPRAIASPAYSDLGDAQIVPVSTTAVRPVRTNQVVYDERPVEKKRSVAKSAIIIGSSAGAGAGVGAAIGGKKGALIGAAVGGGGAALWDQLTRRK